MFDLQTPFFRPLWIRIAVVLVTLGWAGVELATGSVGFAMIFAALGLFAGWQFFWVWDPEAVERKEDENG